MLQRSARCIKTKHLKSRHTERIPHLLLIGSFITAYSAKKKKEKADIKQSWRTKFFAACLTQAVAIGTDTDINGERLQRLPQVSATRPSKSPG